jgi:hypothetical protein
MELLFSIKQKLWTTDTFGSTLKKIDSFLWPLMANLQLLRLIVFKNMLKIQKFLVFGLHIFSSHPTVWSIFLNQCGPITLSSLLLLLLFIVKLLFLHPKHPIWAMLIVLDLTSRLNVSQWIMLQFMLTFKRVDSSFSILIKFGPFQLSAICHGSSVKLQTKSDGLVDSTIL